MYSNSGCRCTDCREGERLYQAAYRQANAERLKEYDRQSARDSRIRDDPAKRKVRGLAFDRLARRKQKQPCEHCGSTDTQLHHSDYSRPLDVARLCPTCHGIAHRKLGEAAVL